MRGAPRLWAVRSWWARRVLCCVLMLCDWLTKCPTGSVVDSWKPRLLLQNIKWGTFLTKASYCCPLNNSRTAYCISKKLYIYVLFKVSYFMHLKTSLGNWKKKSEQSKEVTKGERTREILQNLYEGHHAAETACFDKGQKVASTRLMSPG